MNRVTFELDLSEAVNLLERLCALEGETPQETAQLRDQARGVAFAIADDAAKEAETLRNPPLPLKPGKKRGAGRPPGAKNKPRPPAQPELPTQGAAPTDAEDAR